METAEFSSLRVDVVGQTVFTPPADIAELWSTDAEGGQALAEFAGRLCYESWNKPNPATATNAGYLAHILEVGHYSVLEHGVVSLLFRGVSRGNSHELVRHRHLSPSQLSQRFTSPMFSRPVLPPMLADDPRAKEILRQAWAAMTDAYLRLFDVAEERVHERYPNVSSTLRRKKAREAARSVLPNATDTKLVLTGNYRAWRSFLDVRGALTDNREPVADEEMYAVARCCWEALMTVAPDVFRDYTDNFRTEE
jgi:thymidylate synthase (FAD)